MRHRPVPPTATHHEEQCDNREEYTEVRCSFQASVYLPSGDQFCFYCAPALDEDTWNAIGAFRDAGMIP